MPDLTIEEVRAVVTAPGYNAFGGYRIYGVIGDEHECAGQIAKINSKYDLDRLPFSRLYDSVGTAVPIGRA